MERSFDELVNEVRSKVNIVDVISNYIQLTKRGKNYFGLCPFHDDHNPSLSVSLEKQIYRCFACGASGNVFNFIMDYEKKSFSEVLNKLATSVGVELPNYKVKSAKVSKEYQTILDVYDITNKYFRHNLVNTESGKEAYEYLLKRNITKEIIEEFSLGYAKNDRDELKKLLVTKGYQESFLADIGILNKTDYGYQNAFVDRIIFPIWNEHGEVIAFSGRKFKGDDELPKYINTKETKVFKKGTVLYNFHRAKDEIRRKNEVIIMEGFFDVIRAYSLGFKNVIATMGTSLTKEQLVAIKRITNNVILCFDGDEAGQKSMMDFSCDLEKIEFTVCIVPLKDGLDPDEYLLKYGVESFKEELKNAYNTIDFRLKYLRSGKNLTDENDITLYINESLKLISTLSDEIKRELYINKLAEEFNLDSNLLRKRLNSFIKDVKIEKKDFIREPKKTLEDKYTKASKLLVANMLKDKRATLLYAKKPYYLPVSSHRFLANEIVEYYKKHDILEIADFITFLNGKTELINLATELSELDLINKEYTEKILLDYIAVIKEYNSEKIIKKLKEEMKAITDPNEKAKIAEKIREIKLMGCDINGGKN
ncbi:MAG TPA: DNA primase [Tenericutes bacterium]|jgi:DNA primase|nr:DNA primase [Mycoplasmatota bacterium]